MEHVTKLRGPGKLGYECTCGKPFPVEKAAIEHANKENAQVEAQRLKEQAEREAPAESVDEETGEISSVPSQYAQAEQEVKSQQETKEQEVKVEPEKPKRGRPAGTKTEPEPKREIVEAPKNNTPTGAKISLQTYLRSGAVEDRIRDYVGKDGANDFITSLMTAVSSNAVLQDCEPNSIITAALTAAAMNLAITPSLGFAHIVPYKEATKDKSGRKVGFITKAQFQIGWKGFVQLALRTQRYKYLNAGDVRRGEYGGLDRRTGESDFNWVDNEDDRNKLPVIGYFAYLELKDGFAKTLYMTVEELKAHAKKYSKSYQKGYGKWVDDFPVMAKKTTVKLLIGKYGPMSTEIIKALEADQAVIGADDSYDYVDNKSRLELPEGALADKVEGDK